MTSFCPSMLLDAHVHIGQYKTTYHTPPAILRVLAAAGITHCIYSSTSSVITDDAALLRDERASMHDLSNGCAYPLLWVTHSMLSGSPDLSRYLDERVVGLKIHGVSERWPPTGRHLRHLFAIARERQLGIMVHTGENLMCTANDFLPICKAFPEVPLLLAHGRPQSQISSALAQCQNLYVDTAFMPHAQLRELLQQGFASRILFGTDTPIPRFYLHSSLPRHLRSRIRQSRRLAANGWPKVAYENACRCFPRIFRSFTGEEKRTYSLEERYKVLPFKTHWGQ